MMHNKTMKHIGRLLLWASASLGCLAFTEAGQEMVRAMGLDLSPAQPDLVQPAASVPPLAPLKLDATEANPPAANQSPLATGSSNPSAPSLQTASPAARPGQSSKLAINAGTANQQTVQLSQAQIATGTWQGASFPVENFQAYTSPFGYRSSPYGGYTQEFHYGLDMAAPEGSYIRAWWSGKVVEVSDDSNCGTSVVVESGPWMHIYCHMQGHVESKDGKRYMIDRDGGIQIWEDQQIQAGSRLGRVGMTGRTTGPHLHWGLKYDKNWVDPALVLRAMYVNQQQTATNPNREPVQ